MSKRDSLLIVDDDPGMRDTLAQIFQQEGYETCTAETGQEAVDRAMERLFDAALIDIRLPDTEGSLVLRRLKKLHAGIAGIMVTGYASVGNAVAALNEGADAYVEKPFTVPQLKATVEEALGKRRLAAEDRRRLDREMRQKEHYKRLSIIDGLTYTYNYRHFRTLIACEVARAKRYTHPLSLIIADIDHFKEYNDRYGHPAGDEILKKVARILKRTCRETDSVFRYGGDEFAVIMPETGEEGTAALTKRLKQKVEQAHLTQSKALSSGALTISVGQASYPSDAQDKEQLIFKADQALYQAKYQSKKGIASSKVVE